MYDTLAHRVWARFGDSITRPLFLKNLCRQLVDEQKKSWDEFKNACESLNDTRQRDIDCTGFKVRLIYNPGRSVNTLAKVAPEKIVERPCFLCMANLPAEQKAILYRNEFLILVNPRPILPLHLTIAHRMHRPQSIRESTDKFLGLMKDIGPDFTVLYNGPRCGASAPDHLHFQAVPSGEMPIEKEFDVTDRFYPFNKADGVTMFKGTGLGREVILIESDDPGLIHKAFLEYLDSIRTDRDSNEEPMINVIGHCNKKHMRVLVFPRRAHRPEAFYREDEERIMVSPAVMEMGGIMVTPSQSDFDRLSAPVIEDIYREVSLISH